MIISIKKKAETVYNNIVIIKLNKKASPAKSTYHQLNTSIQLFQWNLIPKNCLPLYSNKTMFLNSNKMKRMKFQMVTHHRYSIESLLIHLSKIQFLFFLETVNYKKLYMLDNSQTLNKYSLKMLQNISSLCSSTSSS